MLYKKLFLFLFFIFIQIKSESEITIYATDEVFAGCEGGFYLIDLQVKFSSSFDKYYTFELELENPYELKFKCFIHYKNSSITCLGNLYSNDFDIELGEFIEFPINFPNVKGIKWDYDSFAKNIYGKGWIVDEDCFVKDNEEFSENDWGLIFNITDVYDDKCIDIENSVENKYIFKIKGNIISGELMNSILNENEEIEVLQDIWIPILIKTNRFRFRKVEDLSFAFCHFNIKLSKSNIKNEFVSECYILIPEGRLLLGNIQIRSFYDFFYIKTKNEIYLENISFVINRTLEMPYNSDSENTDNKNSSSDNPILINNNETNIEIKEKKYISVNYFILGDNEIDSEKIYCPDKPLFRISNSDKDIRLFSTGLKNYTFTLEGILFIQNKNYSQESFLYNEIVFYLQVNDILAENVGEDNTTAEAKCTIPIGSSFYKKIVIYCNANKISEESKITNDTDIELNWNVEKNRIHQDLIVKWPEESKKKKHMYSYTINGFSLVNQNFGCYENKFYFYVYIYNLNFEPDIEFEIQMKNPSEPKAICKIYDPSILKCHFPLDKKKLEKDYQIDMMTNYTYLSMDEHGNKVTFIVEDYDYDYEDFHLTLTTSCGDYLIVGLLKNAGINYVKVAIVVLCIILFVIVVIICFICYIVYKIKSRNMKGKYMKYVEEQGNNMINNNIK